MTEKVLIIGLGEIGHTLFSLYIEKQPDFAVYGLDLDEEKMMELNQSKEEVPRQVDVLQVCLPCNNPNRFAQIVADYAKQYMPKLVVNNSTVPPGTTLKIAEQCNGCLVAHSPSRGVHITAEHMLWEMKRWPKYVGGATKEASKAAKMLHYPSRAKPETAAYSELIILR